MPFPKSVGSCGNQRGGLEFSPDWVVARQCGKVTAFFERQRVGLGMALSELVRGRGGRRMNSLRQ